MYVPETPASLTLTEQLTTLGLELVYPPLDHEIVMGSDLAIVNATSGIGSFSAREPRVRSRIIVTESDSQF